MVRVMNTHVFHPFYMGRNRIRPSDDTPIPIASGDKELQKRVTWRNGQMDGKLRLLALDSGCCLFIPDYCDLEKLSPTTWDEFMTSMDWDDDDTMEVCWRASVAYEKLGEDHPRILRHIRREPWTGFPVLSMPSGPHLVQYLRDNRSKMYPEDQSTSLIKLSSKYQPLVITWGLQLLSVYKFVHSKGIVLNFSREYCFLSKDLSLSVFGFEDSVFVDSYGNRTRSQAGEYTTTKDELIHWTKFYYHLMTFRSLHSQLEMTHMPDDVPGAQVIQKCHAGGYESADEVWVEFITAVEQKGYKIDGDSVVGFGFISEQLDQRIIQKD
jgi:hypothetical protein